MQEINCILCGKHNEEVAVEENGYFGRRCADCGVIYISPRPTIDETLDLYGHGEAHTGSRAYVSTADRLRAKHNLKFLTSCMNSGSVLEVGAGTGAFVQQAGRKGFKPYAIELNPTEAAFIRDEHGVSCEDKPLSAESFGGKVFDAIYHCNVTSHFFEPVDEFKKMNDRLAPGGYMVFETGNIGDLDDAQLKRFDLFQYPDHLFFFGENSVRELLRQSGFETVEVHRYSIVPHVFAAKSALALRDKLRQLQGGKPAPRTAVSAEAAPAAQGGGALKKILRDAWGRLLHYCHFTLGALFVRSGEPQTLIFVARKTGY